jgi:ketosteroid isomerase-like protein
LRAAIEQTRGPEIRAELEALYAEWFAAITRHDNEFFGGVLAEDWVYTNIAGEVRGKVEYLDYIKEVPEDAPPNELLAFEVRVFGDIAIAHGDYAVRSAAAGTRVSKVGTPFHFSDDSITLP